MSSSSAVPYIWNKVWAIRKGCQITQIFPPLSTKKFQLYNHYFLNWHQKCCIWLMLTSSTLEACFFLHNAVLINTTQSAKRSGPQLLIFHGRDRGGMSGEWGCSLLIADYNQATFMWDLADKQLPCWHSQRIRENFQCSTASWRMMMMRVWRVNPRSFILLRFLLSCLIALRASGEPECWAPVFMQTLCFILFHLLNQRASHTLRQLFKHILFWAP